MESFWEAALMAVLAVSSALSWAVTSSKIADRLRHPTT